MFEPQVDIGIHGFFCEIAAEGLLPSVVPADGTVEGECYGIEYGGLTGTGLPRDQEQTVQPGEVQTRLACVCLEGAHLECQKLHCIPSSTLLQASFRISVWDSVSSLFIISI